MWNQILMGALGALYMWAGIAMWRNRRMDRPVVMMLASPLFLTGALLLLGLVADVPHEFYMGSQMLFMAVIIMINARGHKR